MKIVGVFLYSARKGEAGFVHLAITFKNMVYRQFLINYVTIKSALAGFLPDDESTVCALQYQQP